MSDGVRVADREPYIQFAPEDGDLGNGVGDGGETVEARVDRTASVTLVDLAGGDGKSPGCMAALKAKLMGGGKAYRKEETLLQDGEKPPLE